MGFGDHAADRMAGAGDHVDPHGVGRVVDQIDDQTPAERQAVGAQIAAMRRLLGDQSRDRGVVGLNPAHQLSRSLRTMRHKGGGAVDLVLEHGGDGAAALTDRPHAAVVGRNQRAFGGRERHHEGAIGIVALQHQRAGEADRQGDEAEEVFDIAAKCLSVILCAQRTKIGAGGRFGKSQARLQRRSAIVLIGRKGRYGSIRHLSNPSLCQGPPPRRRRSVVRSKSIGAPRGSAHRASHPFTVTSRTRPPPRRSRAGCPPV